jgi:hypothetical protein
MRYRFPLWPLATLVGVALNLGSAVSLSARQPGSISTSTKEQREEISITVYQQDLGLVSEVRTLRLQPGLNEVRFPDVAEAIDPGSVYIQFLKPAQRIKIHEQDFKYDLVTPQTLLRKSIGRPIELHEKIEGQVKKKITRAILLSVGEPNIYQIGDQLHLGHPGRIVINTPPGELVTKPTLIWRLEAEIEAPVRCRVSYLTRGLNWTADYIGVVTANDTLLKLDGWVSIDNHSGISYEDVNLKLIAGQIHRYPGRIRPSARRGLDAAMASPAKAAFPLQERPFFEYRLYSLDGRTNLADKHTKQIRLMSAADIPAQKSYLFEDQVPITPYRRIGPDKREIPVQTMLEVINKKEHNLGIPLPEGRIRIFKADDEHGWQLIGEDKLEHTPVGEKIRLTLGEASDIVGERKQMDYKKLRSGAHQAEYRLTLRNHKPAPVRVTVVEHPGGDWHITESSVPFTKKDAHTAEALVEIPAGGEKSITYTIRVER